MMKTSIGFKKVHNHYFDKRIELMKKTQFKVEVIFGDIKS